MEIKLCVYSEKKKKKERTIGNNNELSNIIITMPINTLANMSV